MIMHASGLVQYSPGDTRVGHNGKPVPHILEQVGYRHSIEIKDMPKGTSPVSHYEPLAAGR